MGGVHGQNMNVSVPPIGQVAAGSAGLYGSNANNNNSHNSVASLVKEPTGLVPTGGGGGNKKKTAASAELWDSDEDETVTTKIKHTDERTEEVPAFLKHFRGKMGT